MTDVLRTDQWVVAQPVIGGDAHRSEPDAGPPRPDRSGWEGVIDSDAFPPSATAEPPLPTAATESCTTIPAGRAPRSTSPAPAASEPDATRAVAESVASPEAVRSPSSAVRAGAGSGVEWPVAAGAGAAAGSTAARAESEDGPGAVRSAGAPAVDEPAIGSAVDRSVMVAPASVPAVDAAGEAAPVAATKRLRRRGQGDRGRVVAAVADRRRMAAGRPQRLSRPVTAATGLAGLVLLMASVGVYALVDRGPDGPTPSHGEPAVHDGANERPFGLVPQVGGDLPQVPISSHAQASPPPGEGAPDVSPPAVDVALPVVPAPGVAPAPAQNQAQAPAQNQAQAQAHIQTPVQFEAAQAQPASPRPTGEMWTGPGCGNAPAYAGFEAVNRSAGWIAAGSGCQGLLWMAKSGDVGRDAARRAVWRFDVGTAAKRCDVYILIPNDRSRMGSGTESSLYTVHSTDAPTDGNKVGQAQFVQAQLLGKWVKAGNFPVPAGRLALVLHDRGQGTSGAMHVAALAKVYCTG